MRLNLMSGGRPRGAAGPQQSYSFNAESANGQPGTFTGNANGTVLSTADGTAFWYQVLKTGEVPLHGLRRVENLADDVNTWTAQNGAAISDNILTFAAQGLSGIRDDYNNFTRSNRVVCLTAKISHVSGPDQFTFRSAHLGVAAISSSDLTATSTPQIFQFVVQLSLTEGTGYQFIIANGSGNNAGVFNIEWAHLELLQDSSDVFGGEVIPGTVYNAKAAGVRYFNTTNGNTVAANPGAVTEAAGLAFTGGGYLPEPAAANRLLQSNDLTDAAWVKSGAAAAADLGVTDIGGQSSRLTSIGAIGVDDIVQTASGFTATGPVGPSFLLRRVSATGTLSLINATSGAGGGDWDVDLSAIGTGWVRIEPGASFVTENTAWAASAGGAAGITFAASAGGPLSFDVSFDGQEDTEFATSPVITAGAPVTRTASVLDTDVVITSEFGALLDLTLPNAIGTGNTITLLGPDATAEDVLRVDDSFNVIMDDGGTPVTIGTSSAGSRIKVAYGRDATGRSAALDGAPYVTGDAPGAGHEGDSFQLGAANSVNQSRCIQHNSVLYATRPTNGQLVDLSS